MKVYTFGSVCSGIEAASVALGPLGYDAAWLSEIDPAPCAALAQIYPDVPNLGDMTKIAALIRDCFIPAPDMLCGGTPCQAFSVAGLRNSLDDKRGNLTLIFCEIADEIDKRRAADGLLPAVILWENVPGVLSTKDNAFGCFLAGLAGEDNPIEPPGTKWSNAGCVYGPKRAVAWRVFDAQYFGVAQRRRRVFVVASAREGFDPAEVLFEFDGMRRDSAPRRESRQDSAAGIVGGIDYEGNGHDIGEPTGPLLKGSPSGGGHPLPAVAINQVIAPALSHCLNAGAMGRCDYETETMIVQSVSPIAFDARQDPVSSSEVFGALSSSSPQAQAIAFQPGNLARGAGSGPSSEVFPTLKSDHGRGKSDQDPHVMHGMAVRRLMPIECARLQGFPDDYLSRIMVRGKPVADGPMYKMLGNSWAVPNVVWIGRRIRAAMDKSHNLI